MRVEKDQLILAADEKTLLTVGSRPMTNEEALRLRIQDGIFVEHIVHEVPYSEILRWAKEVVRQLRRLP